MHSSSPVRTSTLQLAAEQPLTGECWIPPKKHIPHPRSKEKPQQDGRRSEIMFRIKPQTHQRCSEGTNKTLCAPGSRERNSDPHKRLSQTCRGVFECLLQRHGSAVTCCGYRGSGCSRLGRCSLWHKSFWRRLPLVPL